MIDLGEFIKADEGRSKTVKELIITGEFYGRELKRFREDFWKEHATSDNIKNYLLYKNGYVTDEAYEFLSKLERTVLENPNQPFVVETTSMSDIKDFFFSIFTEDEHPYDFKKLCLKFGKNRHGRMTHLGWAVLPTSVYIVDTYRSAVNSKIERLAELKLHVGKKSIIDTFAKYLGHEKEMFDVVYNYIK